MKRKLKFKDDVPVFIWIGNRGRPAECDWVEYHDNSKIFIQKDVSYIHAIDRIHSASKFYSESDRDKFVHALAQCMDDQDEDNFFLMLMDFKEWHNVLDCSEENETE